MGSRVSPNFFFACAMGRTTLDRGEGGGNPFASAFVELLAQEDLTLSTFAADLVDLTERKSRGFQRPDIPTVGDLPLLRIRLSLNTEVRVALVLVFSDYSLSGGA